MVSLDSPPRFPFYERLDISRSVYNVTSTNILTLSTVPYQKVFLSFKRFVKSQILHENV